MTLFFTSTFKCKIKMAISEVSDGEGEWDFGVERGLFGRINPQVFAEIGGLGILVRCRNQ